MCAQQRAVTPVHAVAAGEMVVGPKNTLFLDEISTGLDSSTTFLIVRCIRNFAHTLQARPSPSAQWSCLAQEEGAAQWHSENELQWGHIIAVLPGLISGHWHT